MCAALNFFFLPSKGKNIEIPEIAASLNVANILEGRQKSPVNRFASPPS
jgi:hypothetical protein